MILFLFYYYSFKLLFPLYSALHYFYVVLSCKALCKACFGKVLYDVLVYMCVGGAVGHGNQGTGLRMVPGTGHTILKGSYREQGKLK